MRPTDDHLWVGCDVGTQSAQVVAVTSAGEVVGDGTAGLTSRRDGRRHEQDPDGWWQAVVSASRAALRGIDPDRIQAIAVCATSGSVLLTDPTGRPITASVMYDDARAGDDAERVREAGASVWASLGYRMQATWGLPKLVWLLREHAERGSDVRLCHQADVITGRLIGHPAATDASHALKSGYDLLADEWPWDVLDRLGIPHEVMPDVVRPGSRLGVVDADAASQTGIPQATPVIAGMTDGCAAQLAGGALSVGDWTSALGTTLVLKGVSEELVRSPTGALYCHRSPDGRWLPGGASNAGAGVLTERFGERDLAALDARASEREPATVVAYPLVSEGERFPFEAPDAQRLVLGEPVDDVDLYAALLQGLAFVERLCFDEVDRLGAPTGGALRFTGGGARSDYWSQLRADVLRRTVEVPEHTEAALGMALLAAANGASIRDTARHMVRIRAVFEPRREATERFDGAYRTFLDALEERAWLDGDAADHARTRLGQ